MIYREISLNDFKDEFKVYDRDNFSENGYEYLYELFDDNDIFETGFKLDVIAICCDYAESSVNDIRNDYNIDISECEDDYDIKELVLDYLQDNTSFYVTDNSDDLNDCTIIYQNF